MKHTRYLLLISMLTAPRNIAGQKYELAAEFSGMHLHKIDEAPLGVGARFDYNLLNRVAADTELIRYPPNAAGHDGETAALFGIRFGSRFGRFGVFATARPGVIHFGGEYFARRLDHKTHLIFDAGGVMEYYPSQHTLLRIDLGDTVIYYGNARYFNRPNPDALGTVHNFQPGFGFGIRW